MKESNRYRLHLILALSLLLFFFHLAALKLHLYWTTWWMDIINHFLGGAIFSIIFWVMLQYFYRQKVGSVFLELFMLVLSVGILWEVFELSFGLTFVSQYQYLSDTSLDLVMDMLGMLWAYHYFIKSPKQVQ